MPFPAQDRLIRKEVSLGTLRAIEPPQNHIGLRLLAPFMDVASDDVIFDYAKPSASGLAPARAEDAESDLAQKDVLFGGTGRAAVVDWSLKDHYSASDVTRYQEGKLIEAQLGANVALPLTVGSMVSEFNAKVARDDAARRRKLDNRIEWLIMQSMSTGGIAYNDGKIKFTVDFGRPAGQHDEAPPGGLWSLTSSDPIGDIIAMKELMYDTYGVNMGRAITSQKVMNNMLNSDRFIARSGMALGGYGFTTAASTERTGTPLDPNYIIDGWGPAAAAAVVARQTGVQFTVYDSVYRTRTPGSTTTVQNRFFPQNTVLFLPDPADIAEIGNELGFGKTLTSPHPEGNWQPGFYEWEQETKDPWGVDRGAGIKAFPVFPHMELTFTMVVLA